MENKNYGNYPGIAELGNPTFGLVKGLSSRKNRNTPRADLGATENKPDSVIEASDEIIKSSS